jgi:thiol-disulfide isomerase/thioredoxin
MRPWILLLAALPAWPQGCDPNPSTRKVTEQLEVPEDLRLPAADRQNQKIAILRRALATAPKDVFLHEAYQRVRIAGVEINRQSVIAEYESLLAKNSSDPVFLYLAANAQVGHKTKEAITNLERAVDVAPSFGPPHLLLAEIRSAKAYRDDAQVARHADRFAELCPASVRSFSMLRWSKDHDLIARTAARIRKNLAGRTDSEAVSAYVTLWQLEAALQQSNQQAENVKRMREDMDRLFAPAFARNQAWLSTLRAASSVQDGVQEAGEKAQHEIAAAYPHSGAAMRDAFAKAQGDNPYPKIADPEQLSAFWHRYGQAALPVAREFPGSQAMAEDAGRSVIQDTSSTPEQVGEVVALYRKALANDPDGVDTFMPAPIELAHSLATREIHFEDIPDLVLAGFAIAERRMSPAAYSDLRGTPEGLEQRRSMSYMYGFMPLAEAYARLGRLNSAKDTLLQIEEKLAKMRPKDDAPGEAKSNYAEMEAQFWFLSGLYAEKEGRKMDALVDYRNSISQYPPRRPSPDRREEVMASAQRLWKELGGTAQGWNDWAAHSSLATFDSGRGTSSAWAKLAAASPALVLTDSLGHSWKPQDLAKKTTFVTLWASWCGPCRAELPYVEKLYRHFQDRDDVAILALNVDDEPSLMGKALVELKVSVPSVAARDFAYNMLPTMAIPANWLITPGKTQMLTGDDGTLDQWLAVTTDVIEKTAKR